MPTNYSEILRVAEIAACSSAEILQRHYGNTVVRQKSTQNLVTQADVDSEEAIVALVAKHFPDHHILREEGESTGKSNADRLWIIDPLDATNNFAHGIPHFSVSIAYAESGEVKVGVIYDPTRDEMFTVITGQGAQRNGSSIRCSQRATLDDSIIATGFYYDRGEIMSRTLTAIRHLFEQHNIRGLRRMGSAAIDLAWVACGRFEGFFEYQLAPWDYAAGMLLIREAGGRCADRRGADLKLDSGSVIVGNGQVFDALVEVVGLN